MPASRNEPSPTEKFLADQEEASRLEFEGRPLEDPSKGRMTNLYFIQAESGGPIKIGVANYPNVRLGQLQTGNPERLVIRRQVRVNEHAERRFHALFAEHRVQGEWFRAVPEIAAICDAVPDAEPAQALKNSPKPVCPVPDERLRRGSQDFTHEDFERLRADPDLGYVRPHPARREEAA